MKSIRLIFYIAALAVLVISVSIHKKSIIASREAMPPSVLSILMEKGAPVKTFNVKKDNITELSNVSLEKCGSTRCFYVTRVISRNLRTGNSVFSQDLEEIGKISQIFHSDSISGLVRVNVNLNKNVVSQNEDSFKIVKVAGMNLKNALVVPVSSVDYDNTSSFVWMYNQGEPKKQYIKLGVFSARYVEVKEGLSLNDTVISEGQGLLYQYSKARSSTDTRGTNDPI